MRSTLALSEISCKNRAEWDGIGHVESGDPERNQYFTQSEVERIGRFDLRGDLN